ncbi:exosome complex component RRP4 [Dendroctonus ponderosae]
MSQKIHIRSASASNRVRPLAATQKYHRIFTPGEEVIKAAQTHFVRGHGTYEEGGDLKASVAGVKEQVNKLVSVRPLKSRYNGQVGEVLVGRILEVQQKRWKVDTNSRLDSALLLSSVNLPGGELRRRSAEDQHMMREYLQEGDLISAEVQSVFTDGTLSLHTRSLKYGKLGQGILIKVFPSLVKKCKLHFCTLPFGVSLILGNNGYIWISPTSNNVEGDEGGFIQNLEEVIPKDIREAMARVRNSILALAQNYMMLFDTSIIFAYEESLKYSVHELLLPETMVDLAVLTQQKLSMMEDYEFIN